MTLIICRVQEKPNNKHKTERVIDRENKLVVAKLEVEEEQNRLGELRGTNF